MTSPRPWHCVLPRAVDSLPWLHVRSNYKQLRGGVRFVDELPKNAVGKILRRELRNEAKAEEEEEGVVKSRL
ncbi:hypothetical protein P171DRAFT_425992 [Karstenula rhodostoma CBS 690.94]|uniref:AMP-binding enzyme C-terminal domain-containing protein n=1 Tax=Karstenula rhodostoma CBS 690.94 TaxID=1392251 RepID=A0A9P4UJN1_9PLEO|nr:hypothetical protein P171DRAFT_425992 [Karstenula rhodostoma CBS 690.94]